MGRHRMILPRPWRATGVALLLCLALAADALAATSMQIAPTSLQMEPRQRAAELWLTNSGTAPVKLQVRVFRWTQQEGEEQLLPTTDLMATPPMQELAAGQQQLVRVMRADPQAPASQQYYRLIVDEVPDLATRASGMQFVLRYSIPVFIQPGGGGKLAPQLQARIEDLIAEGSDASERAALRADFDGMRLTGLNGCELDQANGQLRCALRLAFDSGHDGQLTVGLQRVGDQWRLDPLPVN